MAQKPNMYTIPTTHVDGTPATLVNQVVGGGAPGGPGGVQPRYSGIIKYVPSQTSLQGKLNVPQATIVARVYVPEPLVGANTVTTINVDDSSTGWTGGN